MTARTHLALAAIALAAPAFAQSGPEAQVFHLPGFDTSAETFAVEGLCIAGMGWPGSVTDHPEIFETGRMVEVNQARRIVERNGAEALYAVSPGCLSMLRRDFGEETILLIDPADLVN